MRLWPVALALAVLLFASGMVTILTTMAIWPGEAKLTAPLFCDDARSDPYVVRDTYSVQPGETSMTFTLYCVGPRGDHDEVGWARPFMALWALHTAVLVAVVGAVAVRRRTRPGPATAAAATTAAATTTPTDAPPPDGPVDAGPVDAVT